MKPNPSRIPSLRLLTPTNWEDYELLDSGDGSKLERYGPYTFARPEPRATWRPALDPDAWDAADAVFQAEREEYGGRWDFKHRVDKSWQLRYRELRFDVQTTGGRHLGVFPEQAPNWDWAADLIAKAERPIRVLNLFAYTGLATLSVAQAGAQVTHVDASKRAVRWARHNQELSRLGDAPVRWIVDDALKFTQREARRRRTYDGFILDPPKFGRGPGGEVWEFFQLFPVLLSACRDVFSPNPLFFVVTSYAIHASALALHYALTEIMDGFNGAIESGELTLAEKSAGRLLSTALFSRWRSQA